MIRPKPRGFFENLAANARELETIVETAPGIRKVRLEYSFEWIKAGWRLVRAHYWPLFAVTAALVVLSMVMPFLERPTGLPSIVLVIVGGFINSLILAGSLFVMRDLVQKRRTDLSDLFIAFRDPAVFRKVLPISGATVAFAALHSVVEKGIKLGDAMVWQGSTTLSIVFAVVTFLLLGFSLPQMLFEGKTLGETIPRNLAAIRKNLLPLLAAALLLVTLMAVCLAALVLPVFFVALPISTTQQYLIYAALFEDLSPRTVEPAVATHSA